MMREICSLKCQELQLDANPYLKEAQVVKTERLAKHNRLMISKCLRVMDYDLATNPAITEVKLLLYTVDVDMFMFVFA